MTRFQLQDGTVLRIADRWPDHETREPVVLLHGWKQSHRLFDRLVLCLLRRGHRVLCYDHRGMGESDKPEGSYSFDVFAGDLKEVMEARNVQGAILLGWSMGCTVALEYMRLYGERVSGMVLHNGPIRLTQAPDFLPAMPEEQFNRYLDEMEAGWPQSEAAFQSESLLDSEDETLLRFLVATALQTPLDIALKIARNQALIDHRKVVRNMEVPLMAVYAERDPYYPQELAEWIASNSPRGASAVLKESAHCAPLEEPENLAEIITGLRMR